MYIYICQNILQNEKFRFFSLNKLYIYCIYTLQKIAFFIQIYFGTVFLCQCICACVWGRGEICFENLLFATNLQ